MAKWVPYTGPGWKDIIVNAVKKIEDYRGNILLIKELNGELRIYVHGGDYEAIGEVIRNAEAQASITCEECGKPGELAELTTGVFKTLCYDCYQEKLK